MIRRMVAAVTYIGLILALALLALMAFADEPKPGAREALAALRAQGLTVRMITGDHRAAARAMGERLGLTDAEIEARKQEARHILALHSALPGTEQPLWGPSTSWRSIAGNTRLMVCFGGMPMKNLQVEAGGCGEHTAADWMRAARPISFSHTAFASSNSTAQSRRRSSGNIDS